MKLPAPPRPPSLLVRGAMVMLVGLTGLVGLAPVSSPAAGGEGGGTLTMFPAPPRPARAKVWVVLGVWMRRTSSPTVWASMSCFRG
jgi:hypothetical protein